MRAEQDPLVSFSSLSMQRIKVDNGFTAPSYLYYLLPYLKIPTGYSPGGQYGGIPLASIVVGKSVGGAEPVVWYQACASSDHTDWWGDTTQGTLNFATDVRWPGSLDR